MKLKAYAKVNLSLDILGKRKDGYHDIESVIQEINLFDELKLEELDEEVLSLFCSNKALENADNLALRAARLVKEKFQLNKGIKIFLNKYIPIAAGLGGGSSDAAAVLRGLNELWELHLDRKRMLMLAAELGSDVPFFIVGKSCCVSGRGEVVEEISLPRLHYLLVIPNVTVSTGDAYAAIDLRGVGKVMASRIVKKKWDVSNLHNDFEHSFFEKHAELSVIKKVLIASGAVKALLSGSGSCIYGIYKDYQKLEAAYTEFKSTYKVLKVTSV